jgi:hypothetical protein
LQSQREVVCFAVRTIIIESDARSGHLFLEKASCGRVGKTLLTRSNARFNFPIHSLVRHDPWKLERCHAEIVIFVA